MQVQLPERPLVAIRATQKWWALGFRDVWVHRELLYFLAWRDVKVRYKQTILGAAWVVMQPLLTTIVFSVLFGRFAKVPSDGIAYPLFAYSGLLPWTFFSSALTRSSDSLIGNAHLITRVYFPRVIIPAAAVAAGLIDFFIAFGILLALMAYSSTPVTWTLLMLPTLLVVMVVLALGFGMWMAALNVKYRDVRQALPVIIQLWMFATPIIYPPSFLPSEWRWVLVLNPLTGIVDGYRAALFGLEMNWTAIAVSVCTASTMFFISSFVFRRMERSFADLV